jgi:hypothetical protein
MEYAYKYSFKKTASWSRQEKYKIFVCPVVKNLS